MGTTGTALNIVRPDYGSASRAPGAGDDFGTATSSGHTLHCTTDTLGVHLVIKTIGGIKIKNDRTIGTNCNAAASAVNMEESTPIPAAEAGTMQQRVQKKEYDHIGPDHGGPGREIEQHSSLTEAVLMTLAVCLTTGNDLSFRGRGGDLSLGDSGDKSIHFTAASGVFDSTVSDATNNPPRSVEGKAQNRRNFCCCWFSTRKRRTGENILTMNFLFYFCC